MTALLKSLFAQQGAIIAKLEQQGTQLDAKLDAKLDQQGAKFEAKLDAKLDHQGAMLTELREEQATKFHQLHDKMQRVDGRLKELGSEIQDVDDRLNGRVEELENKIKHLLENRSANTCESPQQNNTASKQQTASGSARGILKPPTFDGETPFENFKVQFQAAVRHNHWTTEEQLNALIVALRDKAADVLQTISSADMSGERILKELELRYGQSHTQELCKIQLHNRRQQRGESLQDLEREITKLARQAYAKVPTDVLNGLTMDAFIHAVRDDNLKLHLRTNAKGKTMNEVLALALEYEAARASLSTDSIKLRKLDAEDIAQIKALIKESIKTPAQGVRSGIRRRSRSRSLCYKCQQPGHFMRDCKQLVTRNTVAQPDYRGHKTEEIRQVGAQQEEEGEHLAALFTGNQGN